MTGETVIVLLRGELDVTVEGFLYGRLSWIREMRPTRLVFETAQVTYLDCASARLIAGTGELASGGRQAGREPPIADCASSPAGQRHRRAL